MITSICRCTVCGVEFARKRYGKNIYCSHPCRGAGRRVDPAKAFWAKVSERGPSDCWLWTGGRISTGYGLMGNGGRQVLAHRFSYEINVGPISNGLHVLHKCDNPRCVNPAHLFLGTNGDNIRDRMAKGRAGSKPNLRGSRNHQARLSDDQVRELRKVKLTGGNIAAKAREFRVSVATAHRAANRVTWSHVS